MEIVLDDPDIAWESYTYAVELVIDLQVRGLCRKPYPGHKNGCPKYNTGHTQCPPDAPSVFDFFDMKSGFFMIVNQFDLKHHMQRLAQLHPKWSERQLRCCLYWQSSARKQLRIKVDYVLTLNDFKGFTSTMCPEALGINVTDTLRRIGVALEWPPTNLVRQVALIGRPAPR